MTQMLIVRVVTGHLTVTSAMAEVERMIEESVKKFQSESGRPMKMLSSSHHWGREDDGITATMSLLVETI